LISLIAPILFEDLSISHLADVRFINFILLLLSECGEFLERLLRNSFEAEIILLGEHQDCALERVADHRVLTRHIIDGLIVPHKLAFPSNQELEVLFNFHSNLPVKSISEPFLNVGLRLQ
jgi:hypothetical protein